VEANFHTYLKNQQIRMKAPSFLFLPLILATGLYSCKPSTTTPDFALDGAVKMRVSNMFRKDSVLAFIQANGEINKPLADQYLQKAENLRKDDFPKAVYYYKRAITLFPDDKTYIQLGNVLMEKEKYDEAHEVFETALNLNPAQSEKQYVQMIKNNLFSSIDYSQYFLLDNYHKMNYDLATIQTNVVEDEKIKSSLSPLKIKDFISNMNNIWQLNPTYDENSGGSFADFIKQFEPVTLPFACSKKELQRFVYDSNGDYEEYDPTTDFSRFSESSLFKTKYYCKTDFQYLVKETNNQLVLIQAVDTSGTGVPRDMRCVYHRLVIYNTDGKLMDSKIIGAQAGETLITYTIHPDLTISREAFIRKWKKPFVRYDVDNEILSTESTPIPQIKITDEGKIVEENPL
jgi:tetratricopeptide (TPR) repeat protein